MRNFIKQEIQSRKNTTAKNNAPESVPNEAILEYASLFQELDDLTSDESTRNVDIEIPLAEDNEAETIEVDLGTDNVLVNKDATVASVTESYSGIKTYEEFYQEAADAIAKLPRESEDAHERRVVAYADKLYNEYCEEAKANGFNGFDKINITNENVPARMNVNFGAMNEGSNAEYVTKVNTFFATDENHNITKKQLDSISLVKMGALKNIGSSLKAYMESNYDVDTETSVWDVCTPKTIIVPKGNADSFCVVVEYTNEITGENEYFGWTAPVTSNDDTVTLESCEEYNMASFLNDTHYENHDKVVQEMAEAEATKKEFLSSRKRPSRFYQEAVEGIEDTTTTTDTTTTEETPTEDMATSTEVTTEEEPKETAAVNDVSAEIADKVAADTQSDAMSDDEEITFSDETNPTDNIGTPDTGDIDETSVEGDESVDTSIEGDDAATDDADAALSELDDAVSDSEEVSDDIDSDEETGALDVDNVDDMSVNELLELGKESLKDMKVGDLKELIANKKDEEIQEAFIYTSKNINKELDIKIRECLGILNDNKDNADQILIKFKNKGHKLNRALSKAAGMKKIYSSDEIKAIKDLNEALAQLLLVLRKKPENYGSMIKGKITDFTNASKKVSAIIEDKLGKGGVEEVTQEAFLLSNINDKITKALIPVKADMSDLSEKYQAGQLTRGRLIKKYSSSTTEMNSNMGGWQDSTITGYSKHAKNIDSALKLLNKALRKKTVDKAELIEKLADKLDIVSDYIETVIDDKNENKEYVNMVGKLAGEIVDLINQFIGDDSANVEDETLMNATDDTAELDEDVNVVEDPETGESIEDDEASAEMEPEEDESSEKDDDDKDEEGEDE